MERSGKTTMTVSLNEDEVKDIVKAYFDEMGLEVLHEPEIKIGSKVLSGNGPNGSEIKALESIYTKVRKKEPVPQKSKIQHRI